MPAQTPNTLVIVFDGIEEIEALTPVDILRRAGINVTLASVNDQPNVTGRNQITFSADTSLALVARDSFDLVILPGGPGVLELLDHPLVRDILLAQNQAGKHLAAICAAPKILAHHGILANRQATSHASVRSDLPHPSDVPTITDAHITTSQGLGTAIDFSLELVKLLKDETVARQISDSIHFKTQPN